MLIGIIIYIAIAILTYYFYFRNQDISNFEKIWDSIFWIAMIPLFVIHKIHNS